MNIKSVQDPISFGNETIDKFFGGGLLRSSLNLIELNGPNSRALSNVFHGSLSTKTLLSGGEVIYVEFNTRELWTKYLPMLKRVSLNRLGITKRDLKTEIKIAWRYTDQTRSHQMHSDMEQIDLLHKDCNIRPEESGRVIRVSHDFSLASLVKEIQQELGTIPESKQPVNIVVRNILHPLSPAIDNPRLMMELMYTLRTIARTLKDGAILVDFATEMFEDHDVFKNQIYNLCDSVISCYGYEDGEDISTGYVGIAGTIDHIKVPKIDSFGFSYQRELTDWGFRFTANSRHFIIEELNLPCGEEEPTRLKVIDAS